MNDQELLAYLRHEQHYLDARRIPGGPVIAVQPMCYTFALVIGCSKWSYESRYCYETAADVRQAFEQWDGKGDPPGPWIKHKGAKGGDRLGPGATDE